ncbi:MAG: DUF2007 domain-containing protein [Balneolales bacterium]
MLNVYSSPVSMMAYHVKNLLEQNDIECTIKGEQLTSAIGGVAPIDAWIEVWILDDDQANEAKKIVDAVIADQAASAEKWKCPECGEEIEGNFSECWKCGTERF